MDPGVGTSGTVSGAGAAQTRSKKKMSCINKKSASVSAPVSHSAQPTPGPSSDQWEEVVKRVAARRKKGTKGSKRGFLPPAVPPVIAKGGKLPPCGGGMAEQLSWRRKLRAPRSSAIVLTCPPGKYAEVMRAAKSKIDLAALEIRGLRPKRAITGAFILEIDGADGETKADRLASLMREALGGADGIEISRPHKTADVRVRGIDESVVPADVAAGLAGLVEGCEPSQIKVGPIRASTQGLGTAWACCQLPVAKKAMGVGWARMGIIRARIGVAGTPPTPASDAWSGGTSGNSALVQTGAAAAIGVASRAICG